MLTKLSPKLSEWGGLSRFSRSMSLLFVALGLLGAVSLLSVSVAASADLHPGGFDKNCSLCQFSKAPLIDAGVQIFVTPDYSLIWELREDPVCFDPGLILLSGLCRAPPTLAPN